MVCKTTAQGRFVVLTCPHKLFSIFFHNLINVKYPQTILHDQPLRIDQIIPRDAEHIIGLRYLAVRAHVDALDLVLGNGLLPSSFIRVQ